MKKKKTSNDVPAPATPPPQQLDDGGPARPIPGHTGMSLRHYAAIHLKVPNSGIPWLDKMIVKSQYSDFAGQALQGIVAGLETPDHGVADNPDALDFVQDYAKAAYLIANTMTKKNRTAK
jgi:hypothetical protein